MQKYIDVGVLKEWIENWLYKDRYYHNGRVGKTIPITELYDILEQMPSADVVEVVRCKDCKHGRPYKHTKEYVSCEVDCEPIDRDSDFFCCDGKRREC